ncbi:hypothetical protein [Clostridium celatum]|uniref:hypothetical protein n=1 Tax=Clostridium celatum TaxID=36834 RepID=UPI00319DE963
MEEKKNNDNEHVEILKFSPTKQINSNSLVAENNTLKIPFFLYGNYKEKNVTKINEKEFIEKREYAWIDANNIERKFKMQCLGRLPRQFESDTFFGLMGLFTKKIAPVKFETNSKKYQIENNKLEFTWYELCDYMQIPRTGYYIKKLKQAIKTMYKTEYYSYANGSIYDKENKEYLVSEENGMRLISDYTFRSLKSTKDPKESNTISHNIVYLNVLMIENIRNEYFKFLDYDFYFKTLNSGLERALYGYLETNRYANANTSYDYIKRNYEVLRYSVPIDFEYPSELKIKTKKVLKKFIKEGYLKDFAYGDELKINGLEEESLYFCFNITADEVKSKLELKKLKEQQQEQFDLDNNNFKCKLPEDTLENELINRGVDSTFAAKVVKEKDKWSIITYILWIDKKIKSNAKILNPAGMLSFALRSEMPLVLGEEFRDIINFIEQKKLEEKNKEISLEQQISDAYNEYISQEIETLKDTEDYKFIHDQILMSFNERIDTLIKINKENNGDITKYIEFKEKREESTIFKESLEKELKLLAGLMSKEDFTRKYLKENNLD